MIKATLQPTAENTFRIVPDAGLGFSGALTQSHKQEQAGDIEGACNTRFEAFQELVDLLPDGEEIELDWEDDSTQDAILLVSFTAIDHFLIGDFEMCAAMLELLLEIDTEDHTEASKRLAYTYIALEEYELFDEVINDVSDKYPEKDILKMWSEFRQTGSLPDGELVHFKKSMGVYFNEFVASEHPVSQAYLTDIESERPSREALAREMWLQTEHLWVLYPGFIEELVKRA